MSGELTDCPACARGDGDVCEGSPRTCATARRSAQDAGIPLAVILGEKTLRQCFDQETIDIMCNKGIDDE